MSTTASHVTAFAGMMTGRHGDRLEAWITAVDLDDLPHLHSFCDAGTFFVARFVFAGSQCLAKARSRAGRSRARVGMVTPHWAGR